MPFSEGSDVVLERSFVFEIRPTAAIPQLAAVLFMCSPIAFDGEGFAAFSAHKRLCSVLSLVMSLESSEVFEWLGSWMVDVVLAALSTTVAW